MKQKNQISHSVSAVMLLLLFVFSSFSYKVEKYISLTKVEIGNIMQDDYELSSGQCICFPDTGITITNEEYVFIFDHPSKDDSSWTKQKRQSEKNLKIKFELKYFERNKQIASIALPVSIRKKHSDYKIRFMAVSAPFWASSAGNSESYRLDSRTPFSLQNALRMMVPYVEKFPDCNWSNKKLLNDSVFLLNYEKEDLPYYINKLDEIKPQVLFIGAMTLSFPGALSLAKIAKEKFGDEIFIVLGGKHANETIYSEKNNILHHPGSPALLMQQGKIPQVFDLVVSGDGEGAVLCISHILINRKDKNNPWLSKDSWFYNHAGGNFILACVGNGEIKSIKSKGLRLNYDGMLAPAGIFGANTSFDIFGGKKTAHVYSDMSKGCVMNCSFCSEANIINGKLRKNDNPAKRMYHQQLETLTLQCIWEDSLEMPMPKSCFVEDSILLGGNPKHLNRLADLLAENPLDLEIGAQFTIDNLLNSKIQRAIIRLRKSGLVYIYTGMETANESIATTMSKNTHKKEGWIDRNEQAIRFLKENDIKFGVSVLWGLGETQKDRLHQLELIKGWKEVYGNPRVVSLNWATSHPLFNKSNFEYTEWGTDIDSPYLPILVRMFGEASERYCMNGISLPTITELELLEQKFKELKV